MNPDAMASPPLPCRSRQSWLRRIYHPDRLIVGLIFITCLFVYLANARPLGNGDTLPNGILALNWMQTDSLHLDAARQTAGPLPWYLVTAANGHITSTYPIGTVIVTWPIYFAIGLYYKGIGWLQTGHFAFPPELPSVLSPEFHPQQQRLQQWVATIITGLSVLIFYQATRLKFSPAVALWSTFIFGFATSTFAVTSQWLWQFTAATLLLLALLLALLKANRATGEVQAGLLLLAGFFAGLLPGTRPTFTAYAGAALVYVGITYRWRSLWFGLGLCSLMLSLNWNVYYFGIENWIGGYAKQFAINQSSYIWSLPYAVQTFWGLLISPSRGWLTFMPVMLFATPGLIQTWRDRRQSDERLLLSLLLAAAIIFLQYCFYDPWYGGTPNNYGSRFVLDSLPIVSYLMAYYLALPSPRLWACFLATVLFSTGVQVIGAFGNPLSWERAPIPDDFRLWDWADSEIIRTGRSIVSDILDPVPKESIYLPMLQGEILSLTDEQGHPFPTTLPPPRRRLVKAVVRNTGTAPWWSYHTGMESGVTYIQIAIADANQRPVASKLPNRLYVTRKLEPGETGEAIGWIEFPRALGAYTLDCAFSVTGMGDFPLPSAPACGQTLTRTNAS